MKRILRGAFSLLLFLIIASFLLSNIVFQERFEKLELDLGELPPAIKNQPRKLSFAVDFAHTSQYDYVFLQKKGGRSSANIHAFLPIDINLMSKLKTDFFVVNLNHLPVFLENGEIRKDYILSLKAYYDSVQIPIQEDPKKLKLAAVRFINPLSDISYVLGKPENFLIQQFKIANLFYQGQTTGMVILPCGEIFDSKINKDTQLYQLAKQIFDSWRLAEKESEVKLQVLLLNSPGFANLALCQSLKDIQILVKQIRQLNVALNQPIRGIEDRLGVALDIAALYRVWYDRSSPHYKDKKNQPLSYTAFWEEVKKELIDNSNRPLVKFILASFYSKDEKDGYHLPFSRSRDTRTLLEQLKFLAQVVQFAEFSPENGFLSLEIPLRELFPIVHRFAKPLAKAWGLYRKPNGADKSEFIYSQELIEKYLAFNLN